MSIGNNKKASALQMRIQQYIIVNLGKDKVNTAAMGGGNLPQPAQASTRLHNRILSRTLGIIIHDSLAFRKIECMASVWLR